jgi:hypothetical protein
MRRRIGGARAARAALVLVALVPAAACGGDDGAPADGEPDAAGAAGASGTGGATGTTAAAVATGGAGGGGTEAGPGGGAGCPGNGEEVPASAVVAEVRDVDGDDRPDRVWWAFGLDDDPNGQTHTVGIATASGAVVAREVAGARPMGSITVVDADERAPVEVLAEDGQVAHLLAFVDCDLVLVTDADGDPYRFDLGNQGVGTGVRCEDADGDGRRDLVGVNEVTGSGGTPAADRTIVELDGAVARNGATDRVPAGGPDDPPTTGVHCGRTSITTEMLMDGT